MNPINVTTAILAANDAARDYRQIFTDAQCPEDIRDGLSILAFETSKRVLGLHRATKFGPVAIKNNVRASLCLVVDNRAVFVVVTLPTGEVSIVSDERKAVA
jgi:hypothetical protein